MSLLVPERHKLEMYVALNIYSGLGGLVEKQTFIQKSWVQNLPTLMLIESVQPIVRQEANSSLVIAGSTDINMNSLYRFNWRVVSPFQRRLAVFLGVLLILIQQVLASLTNNVVVALNLFPNTS